MDKVTKAIDHFCTLMEDQNAKLDAVLEGQKDQATRADVDRLEQRLEALESDVKVIKTAVKDVSAEQAKTRHLFGASRADKKRSFSAGS